MRLVVSGGTGAAWTAYAADRPRTKGLVMHACDDGSSRGSRSRVLSIGRFGVSLALLVVVACGSKASSGSGTGGSSGTGGGSDAGSGGADSDGGHQGATGGLPGTGGANAGGRGGVSGGSGGMNGTGGAPGTGGHDISPVSCGNGMCPLTFQCCVSCDGSYACAATCTSPVCTDAGAGGDGGADAGQVDANSDGALRCGSMTCGPQEACVHPPGPGTCLMPDAGQCPSGTSVSGNCCLPPLDPRCVALDRPCSGPTVTCACFSVDPCGSQLCAAASFDGRVVMCHGA
jgi:hypothetical protein